MDKLYQIIDGMQDQLMDLLSRWIAIPSVKAPADGDAPFGAQVKRALHEALADCEKLGFIVRNVDNYAGDARMGKIGVNPLGILAHLDVVPAGDGWQMDPFTATVKDGRVYGRGTSDDKGPAVAALLAMHAVLKAGVPLRREVRLILGCDEESGWKDIDYYTAHCDMPETGFSPDASFPVINTEKGGLTLELRANAATSGLRVLEMNAGERTNVVPGQCTALCEGGQELIDRVQKVAGEKGWEIAAHAENGAVRIVSTGVTGHAAYPESAKNAIGQLLLALSELGAEGPIKTLAEKIGMEYDARSLGAKCGDETSGPLTNNMGIIRFDGEKLYATLDIRYPLLINCDMVAKTITDALPDFNVKVASSRTPHHVAPSSELVTCLLDAYHAETGRPKEVVATGGGTYARCLKEGVAFGSTFPEDEDLAHQAGEYASIGGLMQNVRIFARAIVALAGER